MTEDKILEMGEEQSSTFHLGETEVLKDVCVVRSVRKDVSVCVGGGMASYLISSLSRCLLMWRMSQVQQMQV